MMIQGMHAERRQVQEVVITIAAASTCSVTVVVVFIVASAQPQVAHAGMSGTSDEQRKAGIDFMRQQHCIGAVCDL